MMPPMFPSGSGDRRNFPRDEPATVAMVELEPGFGRVPGHGKWQNGIGMAKLFDSIGRGDRRHGSE